MVIIIFTQEFKWNVSMKQYSYSNEPIYDK